MAWSRRDFLHAGFGLGVVAATARPATGAAVEQAQWYLFGNLVDVTLHAADPAHARQALRDLAAVLQRANHDWHPWRPGVVSEVNRSIACGDSIAVDEHLTRMVCQSRSLWAASGGAFNPAIGRMIGLWGFHGAPRDAWRPPSAAALAALCEAAPSPEDLAVHGGRLDCRNHAVQLDFGGYAKGYAIDLGRQILAGHGIDAALIDAGGDLATLGCNGADGPWRIALRHPQGGVLGWLELDDDEAVMTTANDDRYREAGGVRHPQVIDPRSGMPVNGVASATVVHHDAALADAAATALVVSGVDGWRETAAALGIASALVVDPAGEVLMTAEMERRARLQRG